MSSTIQLLGEIKGKAIDYLWAIKASDRAPRTVKDIYTNAGITGSRTRLKRMLDEMVDEGLLIMKPTLGRGGEKHRYYPVANREETLTRIVSERFAILQEIADSEGLVIGE